MWWRFTKKTRSGGFTLMELTVTLGVMATMGAIALPALNTWLPGYRLKGAARALYTNFQHAKACAVRDNADWAVVFDVTNQRYLLCSDWGADQNWSTLGDNTVYKTVNLTEHGKGIAFGHGDATTPITGDDSFGDEITFDGNTAVLSPRGTSDVGNVYVENTSNGNTCGVGTSAAGAVRLQSWRGNEWT